MQWSSRLALGQAWWQTGIHPEHCRSVGLRPGGGRQNRHQLSAEPVLLVPDKARYRGFAAGFAMAEGAASSGTSSGCARANELPNAMTLSEAARLSKTYSEWPYRDVLERRLTRLNALPGLLNSAKPEEPEFASMINTRFSCMAGHQKNATVSP